MYYTRTYRGKSHLQMENIFQEVMRKLHNAKKKDFVICFGYNPRGDYTFWKILGKQIMIIPKAELFIEECNFSIAQAAEILERNGFAIDAKSLSLIQRGILK